MTFIEQISLVSFAVIVVFGMAAYLRSHSRYENDGGEFDNNPNFAPYYGNGIIALDACTPVSQKVNCIVIEDTSS